MANAIAKLERERSITTLAKRLFVIEGPDAERKLKHAETALLRANPDLATPEGFGSGRTVVVPGDIGLAPTERVIKPSAGARGILDESGARLELAGKALSWRFAERAKRNEATLGQLGDRDFQAKLREALPESTDILQKTRETLSKRTDAEQTRAERFENAVAEAQERLAKLRELAEGRGST